MNKELEKVMLDSAHKKWSFSSTGRAGYCDGWDCAVKHLEQHPEQLEAYSQMVKDYEEIKTDKNRLVREIDIILCGPDAALQASLCDIVPVIRKLKEIANEMNIWLRFVRVFNFIPEPFHSHIMDTLTKYKNLTKTNNNG